MPKQPQLQQHPRQPRGEGQPPIPLELNLDEQAKLIPPQPPARPGKWNWQPIETAPVGRLVLIAICKGSLQCPVRGDRYIAMAFLKPTGTWTLFGQGQIREDEIVTHWIEPELPETYPEMEHMDVADKLHINN